MIDSSQIQVWRAYLDSPEIQSEMLAHALSADEVERAMRFHFEKDRRRYIAARGALRQILGHYLGMEPREIRFVYSPYGKPALAPAMNSDDLRFNLSHAGGMALFAFSKGRDIGIDIERIRDDVAVGQIATAFFSAEENNSLASAPEYLRRELFFRYWTRKEAFLKAIGEGLSFPPERVDVSSFSGKNWSAARFQGEAAGRPRWFGKDLSSWPGYSAAVAVEGNDCELVMKTYFHA